MRRVYFSMRRNTSAQEYPEVAVFQFSGPVWLGQQWTYISDDTELGKIMADHYAFPAGRRLAKSGRVGIVFVEDTKRPQPKPSQIELHATDVTVGDWY
ncbi:hypothetical protein DHEL01_v203451 [Diaporthe helianthi]|uniref:Uncharacterized protein n=1 Tax=Diaporthe helianthi TaxID=158607 RepID=A0A2P5I6N5_DIAHE|nr:hypothetical protein DHEL01_v203451 [Diaporthe helianthi]